MAAITLKSNPSDRTGFISDNGELVKTISSSEDSPIKGLTKIKLTKDETAVLYFDSKQNLSDFISVATNMSRIASNCFDIIPITRACTTHPTTSHELTRIILKYKPAYLSQDRANVYQQFLQSYPRSQKIGEDGASSPPDSDPRPNKKRRTGYSSAQPSVAMQTGSISDVVMSGFSSQGDAPSATRPKQDESKKQLTVQIPQDTDVVMPPLAPTYTATTQRHFFPKLPRIDRTFR